MSSRALAQRRHHQRHYVQAVVEILAKCPGFYRCCQILVGGGDQANVHRDGTRAAQALELPLLQHAQQLDLQRRRQLPNLIQKHHAAIGHFQPAFLLSRRRR